VSDPSDGGVVSSLKDDVRCGLSPVGPVFDGFVCGRLLCTWSGRHRDSNEQDAERGELSVWDDESGVDAYVDKLFNVVLDKTKEEHRPDFWRSAGLLMVG